MENKTEIALNEIVDILNKGDFPEITEARIILGQYNSLVPLSQLQASFSVIKVLFVPERSSYAYLSCKRNVESTVVFEARVAISELKEVVTTKTTYEVPQPTEIVIIDDPETQLEAVDLEEDVVISIVDESEIAEGSNE